MGKFAILLDRFIELKLKERALFDSVMNNSDNVLREAKMKALVDMKMEMNSLAEKMEELFNKK